MSKTILLADDSVTIQKVVDLAFREEEHQVVAVSNGDEALARMEALHPAIVITDVHMPGASGYDVCRRVKESRPSTPVLLLVGTFEVFDEGECESCGADGHLRKPFDSKELVARVKELTASKGDSAADAGLSLVDDAASSLPGPTAVGPSAVDASSRTMSATPTAVPDPPTPKPSSRPQAVPAPPVSTPVEEGPTFDVPPPRTINEPDASSTPQGGSGPGAEPPVEVASASTEGDAPIAVPAAGNDEGDVAQAVASLDDPDLERLARRVAELIGERVVREIAWDVVPDMAEVVIKERLRELERQVEEL